jgi:hypothetical protein
MRATQYSLSLLSLLVAAALGVAAQPCVPEGASDSVKFEKPSLFASGIPVGAQYTNDPASVHEMDPGSDDDLGSVATDASGCTVTVTNVGGDLCVGSECGNGQPGSADCFEIYVTFTYLYPVTKFNKAEVYGVAAGESVVVWRKGKISTRVKVVCPC